MATVEWAPVTALSTVLVFHSCHTATTLYGSLFCGGSGVVTVDSNAPAFGDGGGGFQVYMSVELL